MRTFKDVHDGYPTVGEKASFLLFFFFHLVKKLLRFTKGRSVRLGGLFVDGAGLIRRGGQGLTHQAKERCPPHTREAFLPHFRSVSSIRLLLYVPDFKRSCCVSPPMSLLLPLTQTYPPSQTKVISDVDLCAVSFDDAGVVLSYAYGLMVEVVYAIEDPVRFATPPCVANCRHSGC